MNMCNASSCFLSVPSILLLGKIVYLKESDCTLLINNVHYRNMLDSSTCILEEIPGFSRLTGLIPDIQHDFLIGTGGVVNSCMRIVFLYLIIERRMTVQELNERILHFSYGNSDKRDKPYATMTEYDTCTFSFKSAQSLLRWHQQTTQFQDTQWQPRDELYC